MGLGLGLDRGRITALAQVVKTAPADRLAFEGPRVPCGPTEYAGPVMLAKDDPVSLDGDVQRVFDVDSESPAQLHRQDESAEVVYLAGYPGGLCHWCFPPAFYLLSDSTNSRKGLSRGGGQGGRGGIGSREPGAEGVCGEDDAVLNLHEPGGRGATAEVVGPSGGDRRGVGP